MALTVWWVKDILTSTDVSSYLLVDKLPGSDTSVSLMFQHWIFQVVSSTSIVPLAPLEPDLTVAELLSRWREPASVFVSRRMACVGCPLSSFETLDKVAAVYGLPLEILLSDLEKAIASGTG